ncbi:unnamed protein product [Rhizophagus irregularis]|nr:unnamed protein product [Rhizophagus irregularis]
MILFLKKDYNGFLMTNLKRAIWSKNNEDNEDEKSDKEDEEVILKCPKNLNEDLNEFLEEWEYHTSVLTSNDIINVYGLTKEQNTSKYMVVMDKKLNEILESENSQAYRASHSDLNDCLINDDRSLDKNTSKKLNESLESEDSHATSLKANEVLVSEDMSDYII